VIRRTFSWSAAGLVLAALAFASCTGRASDGPPQIQLNTSRQPASIEVSGLDKSVLSAISRRQLSEDEWSALLRVSVEPSSAGSNGDMPPVVGSYTLDGNVIRFTPMFPLDPGREYDVRFDSRQVSATTDVDEIVINSVVRPAAVARDPSTTVTQVYPSGDVLPANLLRIYLRFSAPMGLRGGFEHIKLLDDRGVEVVDPFLPIESDYWNEDRTRYTVFFDPGRVKRGILPNREMGRALEPGRRYTLVVASGWSDGQGLPLAKEFRHEFTVRAPQEAPLRTQDWSIVPAAAGTREALSVQFPAPLDYGLMQRAIGVWRGGESLPGTITIEPGETRWRFEPRDPWPAGDYQLVALSILEDVAGNRIGRSFEVDEFERTDRRPEPERFTMPFTVRPTTR
jgi:hypothetical protein